MTANATVVEGDLLDQRVQIIVNAWNRNILPWWLLRPTGVAGAIKRRAGLAPFRELANHGPIPLGGAVITGPGRLRCNAIIHVAGVNLLWQATERSIRNSVLNALAIMRDRGFHSIAFPLIGGGSGGFAPEDAQTLMLDAFATSVGPETIILVRHPQPIAAALALPGLLVPVGREAEMPSPNDPVAAPPAAFADSISAGPGALPPTTAGVLAGCETPSCLTEGK